MHGLHFKWRKAIHKRIVKFGIRSKSMIPRIRSINSNSSSSRRRSTDGDGAVVAEPVQFYAKSDENNSAVLYLCLANHNGF